MLRGEVRVLLQLAVEQQLHWQQRTAMKKRRQSNLQQQQQQRMMAQVAWLKG
jgi:hypothetical protein